MSDIPIVGGLASGLVGGGGGSTPLPPVEPLPKSPERGGNENKGNGNENKGKGSEPAKQKAEDRKRRGRRSTILTDSDFETGRVRRKSLLGG